MHAAKVDGLTLSRLFELHGFEVYAEVKNTWAAAGVRCEADKDEVVVACTVFAYSNTLEYTPWRMPIAQIGGDARKWSPRTVRYFLLLQCVKKDIVDRLGMANVDGYRLYSMFYEWNRATSDLTNRNMEMWISADVSDADDMLQVVDACNIMESYAWCLPHRCVYAS